MVTVDGERVTFLVAGSGADVEAVAADGRTARVRVR